jgi:hypothetical protein
MANSKGHPGNKYALKEGKEEGAEGFALTISLTVMDVTYLRRKLRAEGKDLSKLRKEARKYAKDGIYREIKDYVDAEIV